MGKDNLPQKVIGLSIVAFGLLLVGMQVVHETVIQLETAFVKIEKPSSYRFVAYNKLLKAFVKNNSIDYKELKKSPLLPESLKEIAHISPEKMLDRRERLSFWLNAHNLIAIKEISDRFPITDLRTMGNDATSKKFTVGGEKYSLQTIQLDKIKPLFSPEYPEEVFLMCGGAIGHPSITDHAVEPDRMDGDMKEAAYLWILEPTNASLNREKTRFDLAPFLQWHEVLFAKRYGTPIDFVISFLRPDAQEAIQGNITILKGFGLPFNWIVNDYYVKQSIEKQREKTGQ